MIIITIYMSFSLLPTKYYIYVNEKAVAYRIETQLTCTQVENRVHTYRCTRLLIVY